MANLNVIAIFKDTGLNVTIDIRLISDNSLVIDGADMTEMADGAYKYIFTSYDETLDYLFICKDEYGNKVFVGNDKTHLLSEIAQGNWEINGNQMIFYNTSSVEIMRFDLTDNQGLPSSEEVYKRDKV